MFVSLLMMSASMQTAAPAPDPAPAPAAKKVCRVMPDVSTRIGGKKICRTQQEWDLLARQTVDDLRYRGQSSR